MKRPPIRLPKVDVHSLGFQTKVELAAGAVFTAFYLLVGGNSQGPAAKSFKNIHDVVKEPYP